MLETHALKNRDLKPENILVCAWQKVNLEKSVTWKTIEIKKLLLKISDYGMGRSLTIGNSSQFSQTRGLGTDGYIAPEVEHGMYDGRADVWSFAVIMHELATKEKPISMYQIIPCIYCN